MRYSLDQLTGIIMLRPVEYCLRRTAFDDFALPQYGDRISYLGQSADVMLNNDQRSMVICFELQQVPQYFLLRQQIKSGGRFVCQ